MKFNPGQSRKVVNGRVYIKDTHQPQPIPNIPQTLKEELKVEEEPQIEIKMSGEPSLEPIIEETKIETNEPIRSEQVEKKPASTGSRAPRKRSGSSSKSN
jgi:predicted transglutaminase-like protease